MEETKIIVTDFTMPKTDEIKRLLSVAKATLISLSEEASINEAALIYGYLGDLLIQESEDKGVHKETFHTEKGMIDYVLEDELKTRTKFFLPSD